MFKNLSIKGSESENKLNIDLNWDWLEEGNDTPSCTIICIEVPQSDLTRAKVFSKDEVFDWFSNQVVDISSQSTRIKNLETYLERQEGQRYPYSKCQQRLSGNIHGFCQLDYSKDGHKDKVFLVFVYGTRTFDMKMCAIVSEADKLIKYSKGVTKLGLFKKGPLYIQLENANGRKGVLVTKCGGETIYSLIPNGSSKCYLDKSINEGEIVDVVNLATLMTD